MNNILSQTIITTSLLIVSFNVAAFGRPAGSSLDFNSLDSNSDGQITLQEFKDNAPNKRMPVERIFSRLDSDSNNIITSSEFESIQSGGGRPN